jgi:hypothetical protein
MNDPIVEEVRFHRQAHAARYNNDLSAICRALQNREQTSARAVINRPPRLSQPKPSFQRAAFGIR